MTRKGPAKKVDPADARGRLDNARAHRRAAEDALALLGEGDNTNPVRSLAVIAAIAYADALTARFGGVLNRQDHGAAVQTLRNVLGNRLLNERARDFTRILEQKDEAHYGVRRGRQSEAQVTIQALQRFGDWAEAMLQAS